MPAMKEPKFDRPITCKYSLRQVKNRSIYCTLLDQWVSIRYCEHACRAYMIKTEAMMK